jgi:flagellar basal-body rod modification protein FlgD
MPSAISGFTPTQTATTSSSSALNGMTSGDFLKLMIQQLQQQDPLNPTDSNQLLTQMSQISTLQSNTQMQQSLQGLTLQQSIGAGGNLIGKTVSGLDDNGNAVQGLVTSVKVANKKVRLELDTGNDLPMENVTQIATASTLANAASALTQAQQALYNAPASLPAAGSGAAGTAASTNAANLANLANLSQTMTIPQLIQLLGGTNVPVNNTIAAPSTGGSDAVSTPTGAVAPLAGASGS